MKVDKIAAAGDAEKYILTTDDGRELLFVISQAQRARDSQVLLHAVDRTLRQDAATRHVETEWVR